MCVVRSSVDLFVLLPIPMALSFFDR
jgi:hypothetical protein